eukprot:m.107575 g.107575  ORF g.107575 m.107575 type:complete len:128 (+) comp12768_c0_seq1:10-393(+)
MLGFVFKNERKGFSWRDWVISPRGSKSAVGLRTNCAASGSLGWAEFTGVIRSTTEQLLVDRLKKGVLKYHRTIDPEQPHPSPMEPRVMVIFWVIRFVVNHNTTNVGWCAKRDANRRVAAMSRVITRA